MFLIPWVMGVLAFAGAAWFGFELDDPKYKDNPRTMVAGLFFYLVNIFVSMITGYWGQWPGIGIGVAAAIVFGLVYLASHDTCTPEQKAADKVKEPARKEPGKVLAQCRAKVAEYKTALSNDDVTTPARRVEADNMVVALEKLFALEAKLTQEKDSSSRELRAIIKAADGIYKNVSLVKENPALIQAAKERRRNLTHGDALRSVCIAIESLTFKILDLMSTLPQPTIAPPPEYIEAVNDACENGQPTLPELVLESTQQLAVPVHEVPHQLPPAPKRVLQ